MTMQDFQTNSHWANEHIVFPDTKKLPVTRAWHNADKHFLFMLQKQYREKTRITRKTVWQRENKQIAVSKLYYVQKIRKF